MIQSWITLTPHIIFRCNSTGLLADDFCWMISMFFWTRKTRSELQNDTSSFRLATHIRTYAHRKVLFHNDIQNSLDVCMYIGKMDLKIWLYIKVRKMDQQIDVQRNLLLIWYDLFTFSIYLEYCMNYNLDTNKWQKML